MGAKSRNVTGGRAAKRHALRRYRGDRVIEGHLAAAHCICQQQEVKVFVTEPI